MKKIVLSGLLAVVSFVSAQGAPIKQAVVDMSALLKAFPETQKAESALEIQFNEFKEEQKTMLAKLEAGREEFDKIREQASSKAISDEQKSKLGEELEKKFRELREEEMRARKTLDQRQKDLAEQKMKVHHSIVEKLQKIVGDYAKKEGYTLVLDKSGLGVNAISTVVYSEANIDITEQILKILQKEKKK